MKKILVLSDIHGNYLLLRKILASFENEHIHDYIFCGDSITDGFDSNEVVNLIKSKTQNVIAGNREISIANYDGKSWENLCQWKPMLYVYNSISKENKEYISKLPIFKIITFENKKICISHGTPSDVQENIYHNSYEIFDRLVEDYVSDVYLFAHTHLPFHVVYKDRLFVNVGSVNCPTHGSLSSTYGLLTFDKGKAKYIPMEFNYNFEEMKSYYLNSDYHKECLEWSNIIIYMLKDGFNYSGNFIKYVNEFSKGDEKITSKIWVETFKKFMIEKGLKIHY